MWPQYYESTVSRLVRECLVRLCVENVPCDDRLELDAIVCVSGASGKTLVVRVHQQLPEWRGVKPPPPGAAPPDPEVGSDGPINGWSGPADTGERLCATDVDRSRPLDVGDGYLKVVEMPDVAVDDDGGRRRHVCEKCGGSFSLLSNLRRHERLHVGLRPHPCGTCGKAFSRSTDLQRHAMRHLVCVRCKRAFDSPQRLRDHACAPEPPERTSSSSSQLAKLLTVVCRRGDGDTANATSAGRSKRRKGHPSKLALSSPSDDGRDSESDGDAAAAFDVTKVKVEVDRVTDVLTAPVTPIALVVKREPAETDPLADHPDGWTAKQKLLSDLQALRLAAEAKTAAAAAAAATAAAAVFHCEHPSCSVDAPPFASFAAYESHYLRTHARFPCRHCAQSFGCRNNRLRHEKSHTAGKPYACTRCGRHFSRPDSLREHRFTHTRSYRDQRCHNCGATFQRKALMLAHMKKCFRGVHIAQVDAGDLAGDDGREVDCPRDHGVAPIAVQ